MNGRIRSTATRNQSATEQGLPQGRRVPGVVGGGEGNPLVEVDEKAFERVMSSASSDTVLLDLSGR